MQNKNKININNILIGLFAALMLLKIINVGYHTDNMILNIFERWSTIWLKVFGIGAVSATIIFYINHRNISEAQMSTIGICIFPWLLPLLATLCWGYTLWLVIPSVIIGFIVGYFTYIIDDHLLDIWDARLVSIPFIVGIVLSATTTISVIQDHWKNEEIYVTHKATVAQVIVERYTYHKTKNSSYNSWDYHTSYNFPQLGDSYYTPQENRDYTLGNGYLWTKDRAKIRGFMWIGGYKKDDSMFSWTLLNSDKLSYTPGNYYKVQENYFGTAITKGKIISEFAVPVIPEHFTPALPTDIPSGSSLVASFINGISFFKFLFTEDSFVLLKWVYICIFGIFILLAILYEECRVSLYTFLISFTVIFLIIFAIFAGRSGVKLSDIIEKRSRRRFKGFGGGSFDGGGASGRW